MSPRQSKSLTPGQAAIVSSLLTFGICAALAAYPVGYLVESRKQRKKAQTIGEHLEEMTVEKYNDHIAVYNLSVIRYNQELEKAPRFRTLVEKVRQEEYNQAFEEIMRDF